jgi:hypothetical protein
VSNGGLAWTAGRKYSIITAMHWGHCIVMAAVQGKPVTWEHVENYFDAFYDIQDGSPYACITIESFISEVLDEMINTPEKKRGAVEKSTPEQAADPNEAK